MESECRLRTSPPPPSPDTRTHRRIKRRHDEMRRRAPTAPCHLVDASAPWFFGRHQPAVASLELLAAAADATERSRPGCAIKDLGVCRVERAGCSQQQHEHGGGGSGRCCLGLPPAKASFDRMPRSRHRQGARCLGPKRYTVAWAARAADGYLVGRGAAASTSHLGKPRQFLPPHHRNHCPALEPGSLVLHGRSFHLRELAEAHRVTTVASATVQRLPAVASASMSTYATDEEYATLLPRQAGSPTIVATAFLPLNPITKTVPVMWRGNAESEEVFCGKLQAEREQIRILPSRTSYHVVLSGLVRTLVDVAAAPALIEVESENQTHANEGKIRRHHQGVRG
ncbi:hypothetical protein RJ55_06251 [Drechmeria coniospora]|nr:hypothetical protein RJ55_06251 [Drechmeria coniospora]